MCRPLLCLPMLSRSVPLSIKPDPVDRRDSIKSGAPVGHILRANFMRDVGVVRKMLSVLYRCVQRVKYPSFSRAWAYYSTSQSSELGSLIINQESDVGVMSSSQRTA